MAEAVLFNVAQGILANLGSQAVREIGLWWGINDAIHELETTVTQIRGVLLDAEKRYYLRSESSDQLKEWLGQLRDALYDANDLLDDFSTQALRKQVMGGTKFTKEVRLFFSTSNNQFAYGLKLARKIKAMRDKLEEIARNRPSQLKERTVETYVPFKQRDQTHSSLSEIFVGREDDKEKIKQLLFSLEYEDNVVLVPIVGFGGVGKTTLVRNVYNDEQVMTHFDLKLWIFVSDIFNIQLIVTKILQSATGNEVGDLPMKRLEDDLYEIIRGKKYLLVLDDVWNEDPIKLSYLRDLLNCGGRGSRILVTTRLEEVAKKIGSIPPYKLGVISEEDSWRLFIEMAFGRGQGPLSQSQEEIVKEIVKKCMGVPLAIKTMGSLLFCRPESEWLLFKDKGLELYDVPRDGNEVLPTLKLSYDHLPAHLKQCFAYCRLFPKDTKIDVTQLIELWMAQGYITTSIDPRECPEDIGYDFCMELLSRSFLQVVDKDADLGIILSVKMDDLMHDLAKFVAGDEISNVKDLKVKTRHVSIDYSVDRDVENQWHDLLSPHKVRLRTILNPPPFRMLTGEQCNGFISNFQGPLRVLDLHYSRIREVSNSIHKLKQLRYLDLSWNRDIKNLPESITRLQNLQVLNLDYCTGLRQLPKAIHRLVNLKHLSNTECSSLTCMPRGIGRLASLSKLSNFIVANPKHGKHSSGGLVELRDLNNLRGKLEIKNLQFVKKSASSPNLIEKQHLQELTLMWERGREEVGDAEVRVVIEMLNPPPNLKKLHIFNYGGVGIPSWFSTLKNLTSLSIRACTKIQHLPPLHCLSQLRILWIEGANNLKLMEINCSINTEGRQSGSTTVFFPSLKELICTHCRKLTGWWPSTQAEELPQFTCLSKLYIERCPKLISIPKFPGLESLYLKDTNLELLHQIFKIPQPPKSLFSFPSPLPNSLTHPPSQVENIQPKILPEESSFPHLTSLKELTIRGGSGITISSHAMQHLTSLKDLTVGDAKELCLSSDENGKDDDDDDRQWQCLRSLRKLTINNVQNLNISPKGLQQVTTIQSLSIQRCPNLISLPKWVGNLSSLQHLEVYECPQLSERFENNKGEDWPLIAHIPNKRIDCQGPPLWR